MLRIFYAFLLRAYNFFQILWKSAHRSCDRRLIHSSALCRPKTPAVSSLDAGVFFIIKEIRACFAALQRLNARQLLSAR